jgi:competence protein ComEC
VQIIASLRRAHALGVGFFAYALGILASAHACGGLGAVLCACVVAGALSRRRRLAREALELTVIAASMFLCGDVSAAVALARESQQPFLRLDERRVVVAAVSLERPRPSASGMELKVRVSAVLSPSNADARSLEGRGALLELSPKATMLLRQNRAVRAGHLLRIRARLNVPAGSRNDGEPPQRDILRDEGVAVILAAGAAADVADYGPAGGAAAWWAALRSRCAEGLEQRLPPLQAAVLEGILWGDRGNLPQALRQEFSDTGTVHVLTTAGLHLGIMTAIIAWLAGCLPLTGALRIAIALTCAWAYAALAGLHLPTVRAASMLTAGLIAHQSGRARTPSAVLSAAAFAVTLPHPLALLSASFAMSFACVGGIALFTPLLCALGMHREPGPARLAVELVRTSIAVQLALWPLQALYFNAFTPYALLANIFVVPLIGAVMALGALLTLSAIWLPVAALPLANLTWWAILLITAIVQRCAQLPLAHVDMPPPTHAFLTCYWLVLAGFAWLVQQPAFGVKQVRKLAAVAPALALLYVVPGIAAATDRNLHFDAIDVGQADCLLIRAPGMHALLVDGGGRLERSGSVGAVVAQPIGDRVAGRTVMPFLLRHWVLRLDAIVLTHPHGDHAGGLPLILAREHVGKLYDSAQLYGGPAYRRALDVVRERHIPWLAARRGVSFDIGALTHVRVLAPELPLLRGTASDINNNSVVLRVEYGSVALLLTGDAQSEAEARLLARGPAQLRADVLKVGHHGSAYSSTPEFLAAVQPRAAVISCGLHNVFGHPSPRTLAALARLGVRVYRTDRDGGVSLSTDGRRLWVTSAANG